MNTLPTTNETTLVPWEPHICPGCGWQHTTSDGYCLDCTPLSMDGEDEWDDHDDKSEMCPMGCGRTTEDVYGGPCNACWAKAPRRA